ncbi:MAG: DoxX family protein [Novosphingobium sp.]
MTTTTSATATATDSRGLLALSGRVMLAAIFVLSAISKVSDPASALGYIRSVGLPLPQLALAGAIAVEGLGGLALIFGYRTRLVAVALAMFSLVTAAVFHSALGDQNQFIHFFKNIAMAGGLLQVAAFGAGRLAIDRN